MAIIKENYKWDLTVKNILLFAGIELYQTDLAVKNMLLLAAYVTALIN